MTAGFQERLNQILPRVASDDFLCSRGLGKEIAFFIFDYPPQEELRMRRHIEFLLRHVPKKNPRAKAVHVNLFDFVIDHLQQRKLLDKTFELQRSKGDDFVLHHLEKILHPQKIAHLLAEQAEPQHHNLVFVSGVGSVWPLMRAHTLLSNLHPFMGETPLVMFYPGRYDGVSLRLFNTIKSDQHYRAFRLIP